MNDIKVGHLKPIGQPATPEKATQTPNSGAVSFSQTLEKAVTQANEAARQVDSTPAKDALDLRRQLDEANTNLAKMNQVEQQLRELHQKVTQSPNDKS